MKNQFIETARLILRPLAVGDAESLYTVYRDAAAMRYWDTLPHGAVSDTQAMIAQRLAEPSCWWTIVLSQTQLAIGNVGYLGNAGVPGMGYILHPHYWRQGYMTEAVQAALAYGFVGLDLDRVELWIDKNNIASQRVASKTGFTLRGRFRQKYHHEPAAHENLVYGLYRREWQGTATTSAASTRPPAYSLQPILAVPDVRATAEFYRDRLNFTIQWLYGDPPTHGAVAYNEWTAEGVHIQLTKSSEPLALTSGIALYIFIGPEIEEWYARYQAQGVQIERSLTSLPWGMREFSIRDCNGYLLRFATPG